MRGGGRVWRGSPKLCREFWGGDGGYIIALGGVIPNFLGGFQVRHRVGVGGMGTHARDWDLG